MFGSLREHEQTTTTLEQQLLQLEQLLQQLLQLKVIELNSEGQRTEV